MIAAKSVETEFEIMELKQENIQRAKVLHDITKKINTEVVALHLLSKNGIDPEVIKSITRALKFSFSDLIDYNSIYMGRLFIKKSDIKLNDIMADALKAVHF